MSTSTAAWRECASAACAPPSLSLGQLSRVMWLGVAESVAKRRRELLVVQREDQQREGATNRKGDWS